MRISPKRDRAGIAVVTALFFVVLISGIVALWLASGYRSISNMDRLQHSMQAYHYALLAEEQAIQLLMEDSATSPKADHAGEPWAQEHQLEFLGADTQIRFRIVDMQSKLNINMLPDKLAEEDKAWHERYLATFMGKGSSLDTLYDWIDADAEQRPQGAESNVYQLASSPYLAADRPMVSIEEVRLAGFVNRQVDTLEATLIALPKETAINANTLPKPLRDALLGSERTLSQAFASKGFITQDQLVQALPKQKFFSATSNFFILYCQVILKDRPFYLTSLLYREGMPSTAEPTATTETEKGTESENTSEGSEPISTEATGQAVESAAQSAEQTEEAAPLPTEEGSIAESRMPPEAAASANVIKVFRRMTKPFLFPAAKGRKGG